jgi:SAM-dependent methyltransferase
MNHRPLARLPRFLRLGLIALIPVLAMAATYPAWKPIVRGNRWFVIVSNIGLDSLRRLGLKSDQIGQSVLADPPESEIAPQLARMRKVYGQYLRYSSLTPADVPGKRVLELGPGFTMSIPLLFAADGASWVVGVDKFVPFQTGPYYQHYYAKLRERLDPARQQRYDRALRLEGLTLDPAIARFVYKRELADIVNELGPESYDLIVSNAVLEEIYDPTPVLLAQGQLLRPGGAMVHMIDLRDYGMFSNRGFHPLEFLTIPDWAYRRMVEASGQPDRRLLSYYRMAAARMGYESEIYITHVLGHPDLMPEPKREIVKGIDYTDADLRLIADIRPRLQPQFRDLPDTELLAQSIIFVARKPQFDAGGADRTR